MLIGVALIDKVNYAPSIVISLNKVNSIEMTTWLTHYSFFKKLVAVAVSIHILTKLAFYEQQNFVLFGINNSEFFVLSEKKTF